MIAVPLQPNSLDSLLTPFGGETVAQLRSALDGTVATKGSHSLFGVVVRQIEVDGTMRSDVVVEAFD